MEKRLEVSYVYDQKTLVCNVVYNGIKDSFCAMFDAPPTCKTVHEHVNGFVQYLIDKEKES